MVYIYFEKVEYRSFSVHDVMNSFCSGQKFDLIKCLRKSLYQFFKEKTPPYFTKTKLQIKLKNDT